MTRFSYSEEAPATSLNGNIGISDTTLTISDATGWDDLTGGVNPPFIITIDRGEENEERVLVGSRTGTTLSGLTRGFNQPASFAHSNNAPIEHTFSAFEADENNAHSNNIPADPHDQYMLADGTRHDLTARHEVGTVIPTGVPGAVEAGATAAEGVATTAARSDHSHSVPSGLPTPVGTALAAGTSLAIPHLDHIHTLGGGAVNDQSLFTSSLRPPTASGTAPPSPIVGQLWSDTSTLTLKMWTGAAWTWIAGMPATVAGLEASRFTASSSSFGISGQPANCGVVFTAPQTGRVMIHHQARMYTTNDGDGTIYVSFQIRTGGTIGSGTQVMAPSDGTSIATRINELNSSQRQGSSRLVGLTAGNTYNVRLEHRVSSGDGEIEDRAIQVVPVP